MQGIRTICIGRSGCGKTTLTKQMIDKRPKGMPCIIYDINQEYLNYYPEKFEDFDIFLSKLTERENEVRHTYIVIEEATIFFQTQSNFQDMKNLLVRARHTGNIIQLNFHAFKFVPKGIYNLLDYVVIFKTNDNEKDVTSRFDNPKVLTAYKEGVQSSDEHFYRVVNLGTSTVTKKDNKPDIIKET